MKPSLQLRIGQNLTMTPQLQQAIRLLQLSSVELQTEIQDALDSNMMLEPDEDNGEGEGPEATAEGESQSAQVETDTHTDLEHEDIPEELPVDTVWDDIYDGGPMRGNGGGTEGAVFEQQGAQPSSLRAHLLWQLNLMPATDKDRALAVAIIDALDEDGYLTSTLDEIRGSVSQEFAVEPEEPASVLSLVQSLEPAGVGARDLRECLSLQMRQLPHGTPWLDKARELVDQNLQLLANRDFAQLMRRLRLTQDELQQVVGLVQSLNPRPGGQVQEERTEYIVPDVYVRKEKGTWRVELNTDAVPRLRVNLHYAALVRRADSSADNSSLKTHLQEARWFIKSLQSRGETLLRVATCIVERQRAFLEFGEEAMKPLVLHDIAEALGMHESTISRVTNRKYMHTPRGIYELKFFFSSHVGTKLGGAASSTAVRTLIRKLVLAEEPWRPLSDSRIAEILSGQGINVARRTVAKYREALAIPPSNERKRLA